MYFKTLQVLVLSKKFHNTEKQKQSMVYNYFIIKQISSIMNDKFFLAKT